MSRLVEIKGYDGDYFIPDCGDVFSFKSGKSKILKKKDKSRRILLCEFM